MTNIKMSLAISKFKSIFKNQICHKSCKIHAYKFAFHGEHSVFNYNFIIGVLGGSPHKNSINSQGVETQF